MYKTMNSMRLAVIVAIIILSIVSLNTYGLSESRGKLVSTPPPTDIVSLVERINFLEDNGLQDQSISNEIVDAYMLYIINNSDWTILVDRVSNEMNIISRGLWIHRLNQLLPYIALVSIVLVLVVAHKYILPLIWFIIYRGSLVRKGTGKERKELEIAYMILVLIIVSATAFSLSQYSTPISKTRIYELGLIDQGLMENPQPRVGSNETLWLYIANRGNYTAILKIVIGIDNSTEEGLSSDALIIGEYYTILPPNEYIVDNLSIVFSIKGIQRVVVELWVYDPEEHNYIYTGQWVYLWVNVKGLMD